LIDAHDQPAVIGDGEIRHVGVDKLLAPHTVVGGEQGAKLDQRALVGERVGEDRLMAPRI
jgi:hypothetical protein